MISINTTNPTVIQFQSYSGMNITYYKDLQIEVEAKNYYTKMAASKLLTFKIDWHPCNYKPINGLVSNKVAKTLRYGKLYAYDGTISNQPNSELEIYNYNFNTSTLIDNTGGSDCPIKDFEFYEVRLNDGSTVLPVANYSSIITLNSANGEITVKDFTGVDITEWLDL